MKTERTDMEKFLSNFLYLIWIITDLSHQARVWVRHEGPEVGSFLDTMMDFLDDCELVLEYSRDYSLSKSEYKTLKKLYEQVDEYYFSSSGQQPDSEIVKDPKWLRICKFAKKVLHKFEHYRIPDESL